MSTSQAFLVYDSLTLISPLTAQPNSNLTQSQSLSQTLTQSLCWQHTPQRFLTVSPAFQIYGKLLAIVWPSYRPLTGVQCLHVINAISSRSGTVITGRTSLTCFCVMSISKFFLPFAASMQWPHRIFVYSRSTSAAVCCNRFVRYPHRQIMNFCRSGTFSCSEYNQGY